MAKAYIGISAKLTRLHDTLQHFTETINSFLTSEATGVVNDFESKPNHLIVKAFSKNEPPPLIGVLAGEILYHLRSCLDHFACELTEAYNHPVNDSIEFPIFLDGDKFRNPQTGQLTPGLIKRIGGIDPAKQAIIEGQQPFKCLYGAPEDDPLWHLYELARIDRHQTLHFVSAYTSESIIIFRPPEMANRFIPVSQTYGPIERETEIARFAILKGYPGGDVKVDTNVRFHLALSKATLPALTQQPITRIIGSIGVRVGELIELLK